MMWTVVHGTYLTIREIVAHRFQWLQWVKTFCTSVLLDVSKGVVLYALGVWWHTVIIIIMIKTICNAHIVLFIMPPPLIGRSIKRYFVWRLSVTYVGPKWRTERPRKTKIGRDVVHVTRDLDTTFKIKRSKSRSPGHFTQNDVDRRA